MIFTAEEFGLVLAGSNPSFALADLFVSITLLVFILIGLGLMVWGWRG